MMKLRHWAGCTVLALATVTTGTAADSRSPKPTTPPAKNASRVPCDVVCDLRSQDAAFDLLMEVYRQHQAYKIEMDYQQRLNQLQRAQEAQGGYFIQSDSDATRQLRQLVLGMIHRERDLRLEKMETEVANAGSAYSCARKIDEDYVGEKVPRRSEPSQTQKLIETMIVASIAPQSQPGTLPAASVLLRLPAGPVASREIVEPCE